MLWDKLVKQSNMTIGFLRNSCIDPSLLSYAQLFGQLKYDATPLDHPGLKFVVHEKTEARGTWALHSASVLFISPAMKH